MTTEHTSFLNSCTIFLSPQMITKLNPDCPENICFNETMTLIHSQADGPSDSIHYIWDFMGPPTILIALTPLNSSVSIDWPSFIDDMTDAVQITPPPIYSASLVLTKVWLLAHAYRNGECNTFSFSLSLCVMVC